MYHSRGLTELWERALLQAFMPSTLRARHSGILELQMQASALGCINVTLLFRSHSAAL